MFKDVIVSGVWASAAASITLPFMEFDPKYVSVLYAVGSNDAGGDELIYRINASWVNGSVLAIISQPAFNSTGAGGIDINNPMASSPMTKMLLNGVRSSDTLEILKRSLVNTNPADLTGDFALVLRFSDE